MNQAEIEANVEAHERGQSKLATKDETSPAPVLDSGSGSRTIIWGPLRSASTALIKCISEIDDDIETWFEPYNYCYLALVQCRFHTNGKLELPMVYEGHEEAFKTAKQLVDDLTNGSNCVPERLAYTTVRRNLEVSASKHVFVKDMAVSMGEGYRHLLPKGYKHTFMIRNPLRTLWSYRKVIVHMMTSSEGSLSGEASAAGVDKETFDLGRDDRFLPPGCYVKELYDLWVFIKEIIDPDPVVIDTEYLLANPKATLSAYCAAVGLPFHDDMLQWDASGSNKIKACSEDLLEKLTCWFGSAMKSTCIRPSSELPPRDQITPDVIRLAEGVMKYYNEMYETRLKV